MIARQLERSLRGRSILSNVFEMWVACAGMISVLVFLFDTGSVRRNALAQTIGFALAAACNIAYGIAGATIWVGLLRPSPRWEIVGLFILGSTTAVNGIAIVGIFGMRGTATAITLLSLTLASWIRGSFVLRTALRLVKDSSGPRR